MGLISACWLVAVMVQSPLSTALAELRSGGAIDSDGLLALVTRHFDGQPLQREQATIRSLLAAWDSVRPVPDIGVDQIVAALAQRRDAIESLDVIYHAALYIDPAAAGPLRAEYEIGGMRQWWARWTRTGEAMRRLAAPDLRSVLDEAPYASIVSAGCDRGGLWVLRGDGMLMRAGACSGGRVLGIEGPWAGTGMLVTEARRGLAVVPVHDCAHWVESLDPGATIVEHDGPLLRLRVGWTSPCFIWIDPRADLAVRRVLRRWHEDDQALELETVPSAWIETQAGVEMPGRIVVQQRLRGSARAIMSLDLRAVHLEAGRGVDPALLEPP